MTTTIGHVRTQNGLRPFTKLLVLCTFILIFMGGLVKSHDAGLSVPDWPTTYGENMFTFPISKWTGGIFYEHTHRLMASFVGLLTMGLCLWAAWADRRVWVKILGASALLLVVAQGILGGLTVLMLLPTSVSVAHGVIAQSFFMMTIFFAYLYSKERARRPEQPSPERAPRTVQYWAAGLTVLVFAQLILGAIVRHAEAGLAIPDFPAMGGQWVPRFDEAMLAWINNWRVNAALDTGLYLPEVSMTQVVLHFLHRLGGVLIVVAAIGATWSVRRFVRGHDGDAPLLRRSVYALDALVVIQFALGVFTIWAMRAPLITTLHVAAGALLLGVCTLFLLRALPVDMGDERREQALQTLTAHSAT